MLTSNVEELLSYLGQAENWAESNGVCDTWTGLAMVSAASCSRST